MKILQINAVNKILSTGRICKELNDYFLGRGDQCAVAYAQGDAPASQDEFFIGTVLDHKIHALLSRLSGKQGYFSKVATKKLIGFMESYKPDVVLLHNLHGNYINVPMLLEYLARNDIATVVFLHDCWFYTGKCCYYLHYSCNKWQTGCGNCPSLLEDNKSWFFDRTAEVWQDKKQLFQKNNRLGIIGVSDWITNEAKKSPLFSSVKQIERIYNGINLENFYYDEAVSNKLRQEYNLTNKKLLLCVAIEWNKRKGIDELIAFEKQIKAGEQIVCIGKVSEEIALPDSIIHIEKTHNIEALRGWYSAADVFVNFSKEETFGLVSAEALSCGTPVVCFDSAANPELVGGGCGMVCKDNSVEGLYKCVGQVLSQEKTSYIDSCVNFASNNFNKEKNNKLIYEFITRL